MEPIGPYVFLWAGLDQGCLRNHSGAARDLKIEGEKPIYGFTDFRGKWRRRGRGKTRTIYNQNGAVVAPFMLHSA